MIVDDCFNPSIGYIDHKILWLCYR